MAGIFKAYDVRGTVPEQIDERIAERIGRAVALHLPAKRVVDVGVVSTPMQYFACGHLGGDGGVQVTASHNPAAYNGFKISGPGVVPVGGDSGLAEVEAMARAG